MNKLQELTNRREELQTRIAQMWDELMEVNEYISAIEESDKVKKKSPTNNKRVFREWSI